MATSFFPSVVFTEERGLLASGERAWTWRWWALVTRRPKLPRNATVDRKDQVGFILARALEDEAPERLSLAARLGIAVALVLLVVWQFRAPLLREACRREWLSPGVCASVVEPAEP